MDDLKKAARAIRAARRQLETAMELAAQVAVSEHGNGTSETEIARELGVNRTTVRRWLGK